MVERPFWIERLDDAWKECHDRVAVWRSSGGEDDARPQPARRAVRELRSAERGGAAAESGALPGRRGGADARPRRGAPAGRSESCAQDRRRRFFRSSMSLPPVPRPSQPRGSSATRSPAESARCTCFRSWPRKSAAFGVANVRRRLLLGGLPQLLLSGNAMREHMPSGSTPTSLVTSRSSSGSTNVRPSSGCSRPCFARAGGSAEVTSLARSCELSRPTTMTYLDALEVTHVVHVLRPYHAGGAQELVRQPKN